jgi:hypothetical protein
MAARWPSLKSGQVLLQPSSILDVGGFAEQGIKNIRLSHVPVSCLSTKVALLLEINSLNDRLHVSQKVKLSTLLLFQSW